MPKRPTRQTAPASEQRKKEKSGKSFAEAWKDGVEVVRGERFRFVVGFLLAGAMVFCLATYLSFFFTGADDYALTYDQVADHWSNAANLGGKFGGWIQMTFVNNAFGIPALALIVLFFIYALNLMRATHISWWKTFFHCAFWTIWGSWTLAFVQNIFSLNKMFLVWGGAHGDWFYQTLFPEVKWFGMLLIIVCILVAYCVTISSATVPALRRFGTWVAGLFHRKPKDAAVAENEASEEETTTLTFDTAGDDPIEAFQSAHPEPEEERSDEGDLVFTIEDSSEEPAAETTPAEGPIPAEPATEIPADDDLQILDTDPGLVTKASTVAAEPAAPDFSVNAVKGEEMVEKDPERILAELGPYDPRKDLENYKFPSIDLLKVYDNENAPVINQDEQRANANRILTTLKNYGVEIESIKATVGPTVTLYEVVPKAGVRITKIQSLEADIMLSLSAVGIRIIAPMPGKGTVGIEVPNEKPQVVSMHSVIASKKFQEEHKMRLPIALGRTITNEIFMFDLAKTPHLLVAGATGQGKSVAINAIITSLLYKKHPAELKLVLVDPKMVEFAPYKPLLRHYLAAQPDTEENDVIITDCSKVIDTLNSLVIEMENRYKLLMDAGVRNLEDYNDKFINRRLNPEKVVAESLHHQYLPYIVIVIDEYGDFIMQAGKQVEQPIARITQKARAVGMHMILATQRPSVNIVTGVIKANIPTRIALRTQSVVDSRTVLDAKGADQLIGRGDLLYSGGGSITRVQCAFVDTPEVDAIVEHIEKQQHYSMPYELPEYVAGDGEGGGEAAPGSVDLKKLDSMFAEVARYVVMNQQGSTSVLQRRFEIGYNRAGKLSDQLEAAGIVGPNKGPKGREVLVQDEMQLQEIFQRLGLMG